MAPLNIETDEIELWTGPNVNPLKPIMKHQFRLWTGPDVQYVVETRHVHKTSCW